MILHTQDLVFGDVRELNVLYLPEEGRVLPVDFDGVDLDGKDSYSACLNPDAGLGVGRLQIMEKPHDIDNLERLMARLESSLEFRGDMARFSGELRCLIGSNMHSRDGRAL